LRRLLRRMNERLTEYLLVTYEGTTEPIGEVLKRARSTAAGSMADLIDLVAGTLLAPYFGERYADYPAFTRLSQPVTEDARDGNAMEAIRVIAGRSRTNLSTGVLDGLKLLGDDGAIRSEGSPYARHIIGLLRGKPEGQVVNRGEVIEVVAGGIERPVEKDLRFGLEPAWMATVLAALVYAGEIALTTERNETLEASSVERAATMSLADLANFRHLSQPKQVPIATWAAIFAGLGLQAGLIRNEGSRERAVADLLGAVQREQARVAELQREIGQGPKLWNEAVFTDNFQLRGERGAIVGSDLPAVPLTSTEMAVALREYKKFLEELGKFSTVGRLRNLRLAPGQVGQAMRHREVVERATRLLTVVRRLQPVTAYLAEAWANLPTEHEWSRRAEAAQQGLLAGIRQFGKGKADGLGAIEAELEGLKRDYIAVYSDLHRTVVLGPAADDRRRRLLGDPRVKALETLAEIALMNTAELEGWKSAFSGLTACREFHEGRLEDAPTCPECRFRPVARPGRLYADQAPERFDARLDAILANWRQALWANLSSDPAVQSLNNMSAGERLPIETFLGQDVADTTIPTGFAAAARSALLGISAVTITADELLEALADGGLPCTVEELRGRFGEFIQQVMRGHDAGNTRLMLDRQQAPAELGAVIDLTAYAEAERRQVR